VFFLTAPGWKWDVNVNFCDALKIKKYRKFTHSHFKRGHGGWRGERETGEMSPYAH